MEQPEAEIYIPEVDWFDEFFGPVVNTKYIKALAVSLVQLTPKAGSTFWPSFSASRSNNAPITPEKAKLLVKGCAVYIVSDASTPSNGGKWELT